MHIRDKGSPILPDQPFPADRSQKKPPPATSKIIQILKEYGGLSAKEKLGVKDWILNKFRIRKWHKIDTALEPAKESVKTPVIYIKLNKLAKGLGVTKESNIAGVGKNLAAPLAIALGSENIVKTIANEIQK